MYITYESRQWSEYTYKKISLATTLIAKLRPHARPPRQFSKLLKPNFMPRKLVRVSDMQVVPGLQVNEGYCALSYSWNQSGDSIVDEHTGKQKRVDEGKHKIVFAAKKVRGKPRGRKRIPRKVKLVKFEGLIQQICKDFNIKYIWFDQMCINQDDAEEKRQEIQQMHRIYCNAYCTVALIPELHVRRYISSERLKSMGTIERDDILESEWYKRLWTLEEALMAQRILFVGQNIHTWWHVPTFLCDELSLICERPVQLNSSAVLHNAHIRRSTKEHDRVFALANIFPEVMSKITVDYDQSIHDLLTQFYGALAEHDLSILCFRRRGHSPLYKSISDTHITEADSNYHGFPLEAHRLSSWTGVAGEHYQMGQLKTSFQNYCINGEIMEVTCTAVTNNNRTIAPPIVFESTDIPPIPEVKAQGVYYLAILAHLPGYGSKTIYIVSQNHILNKAGIQAVSIRCTLLSYLLPIKKETLRWLDSGVEKKDYTRVADINLTEDINGASQQLVMLSEISFPLCNDIFMTTYYPVVKKDGDHYKAIGTCILEYPNWLLHNYTSPKQTFNIQ